MSLKKFQKLFARGEITSITVDVFDTVLLRRVWPEDLQFLQQAERVLQTMQQAIDQRITAYEIYSFRQYARQVWNDAQAVAAPAPKDLFSKAQTTPEIKLETWFMVLIDMLSQKYNVSLAMQEQQKLLKVLVREELALEVTQLRANNTLVQELQALKLLHGVRLYFVSDIYLSSKHIRQLLKQLGIAGVFDGGVTSADLQAQKWNGSIFHFLESQFGKNFRILRNLHIGDNMQADYTMALQAGSNALLYRTRYIRLVRPLAIRIGKLRLRRLQQRARREAARSMMIAAAPKHGIRRRLFAYGRLFSAPLIFHTDYSLQRSALSGECLLFVSSEANSYLRTAELLYKSDPSEERTVLANALNRKTLLRALLYELGTDTSTVDLRESIVPLLSYGEKLVLRSEALKFLTGDARAAMGGIILENIDNQTFCDYLAHELQRSSTLDNSLLAEAASIVRRTRMLLHDHATVTVVDVGWGGTIQLFLQSYLEHTREVSAQIRGVYMGYNQRDDFHNLFQHVPQGLLMHSVQSRHNRPLFVPELWEYVYTNKYDHEQKLHALHEGIDKGVERYKTSIHLAPNELWCAARPRMLRLFKHPRRDEIALFGTAKIDAGFNRATLVPMVNTASSARHEYRLFVRHPLRYIRQITLQYNWTAAHLSWYRMRWLGVLLPPTRLVFKFSKRLRRSKSKR